MMITDSPYAAGTPEHSEWVRNTFIPRVNSARTVEDRAKYGAESIGGRLVMGETGLQQSIRAYAQAYRDISATCLYAANQFTIFFEEFKGIIDLQSWQVKIMEELSVRPGQNMTRRRPGQVPRQVSKLGVGWQAKVGR